MKRPVHSYSNLADWKQCPRHYKAKHIDKMFPFQETEAMARGNRLHKAMEGVVTQGHPLPPEYKAKPELPALFHKVGARVEVPLGLTRDLRGCDFFDKKNVWLRGKIDVYAPDVKNRLAVMADWKSGSSKYTDEFQADVYTALLHSTIIEKVLFLWVYFNGVIKPLTVNREQATRNVTRVIERVEADEDFPPRPSWKCRFCQLKTCEYNVSEG